MMMALKIALVLLAVLLIVVCVAILWFIKVVAKAVKSAAAAVGAATSQPCRVTLVPEADPKWLKPEIINGYANQLRALGFEDAGAFRIPEMHGMLIYGFAHPGEGLLAVVYDHVLVKAPTFDICADFTDGSSVSATNTAAGDTLDKQPNHPILWLGDVSAREIMEAVQKFPAAAPRQPVQKQDFADHFKKSYVRSINWRLKKGGASRDEIRRQAEKKGQKITDEEVEDCYQRLHGAYLGQLQAGCIAQYLDDQKPPAAEWERTRSRTFAIAETLELKEIIDLITDHVELSDDQHDILDKVQKDAGKNAIAVMANILDQNIGNLRLKKIAEVKEPVNALILLAPETAEPVDISATEVE